MGNIIETIKNKDGSIDKIVAVSNDTSNVRIDDNYKLIKFTESKKTFRDTLLGTDVGIHSAGFASMTIIALVIALSLVATLYLSFRI